MILTVKERNQRFAEVHEGVVALEISSHRLGIVLKDEVINWGYIDDIDCMTVTLEVPKTGNPAHRKDCGCSSCRS